MPPVIDTDIPPLVNTASAAVILGVTREWVHKLYTTGRLPCRPVGEDTSSGKRRHQHVLFRQEAITYYAEHGLPDLDTQDEPRIDTKIPPLLRTADMAERLGVSRATINQLWHTGKLKGRPVPGANGDTDMVAFLPQEAERALQQRGTVTRSQWAPAS